MPCDTSHNNLNLNLQTTFSRVFKIPLKLLVHLCNFPESKDQPGIWLLMLKRKLKATRPAVGKKSWAEPEGTSHFEYLWDAWWLDRTTLSTTTPPSFSSDNELSGTLAHIRSCIIISKHSKHKQKLWNPAICAHAKAGLANLTAWSAYLDLVAGSSCKHTAVSHHTAVDLALPRAIACGSQLEFLSLKSVFQALNTLFLLPPCQYEKAVHKWTVIKGTDESKARLIWASLL